MKKLLPFIIFGLLTTQMIAQFMVSGVVYDDSNEPLIGVNITEKGTVNGTTSDLDGSYQLTVSDADATLVYSYTGFSSSEMFVAGNSTINVNMIEGIDLGTIQVVGSRSYKRTSTDTPVAVDIIDIQEVATSNGNIELNRILQYLAPSFNATKQSGADGAEHIDPASLRGLGPDQTLVLINGKRRHQSSLINIFGTRGLGNTGTDFNAIPASAIERIEILRDGAAAQYGSDAIAGVINIVLRRGTNKLTGSVTAGAYNASPPGTFDAEASNIPGNYTDVNGAGGTDTRNDYPGLDGLTYKVAANYGFDIGSEGGFVNFTTEFVNRQKTLRPGAPWRRGMGEAEISGFAAFVNGAVPIGDKTEFYFFGGKNYRDTDAYAFTRGPAADDNRSVASLYPGGFTPRITSIIGDNSISAGVRKQLSGGWSVDFNNTIGNNDFHYFIKGTNNATLGDASPTDIDAGGHTLTQNTTNLDFSKYYKRGDDVGFNLAFGAEFRTDNFTIFAGEEATWAAYDEDGLLITRPDQVSTGRPAGSQGFPGYSPANEVDRSRSNFAMYADTEFDISKELLISAALRYENYSDFGSTLNWKLAGRISASDNLSVRGAISTGFRAPSLAQLFYNLRFTSFVDGQLNESLLSANNSPVTKGFGIADLKEEESLNGSLGFTYKAGRFSATVDGYFIAVDDRVIITNNFDATQLGIGVSTAQFFANGVDTESRGLDIVLAYKTDLANGALSVSLAGNLNKLEVTNIRNDGLDEETFFGARGRSLLEDAAPSSKFAANANYRTGKFGVNLGLTQFGKVSYIGFAGEEVNYDTKMTADLSFNVKATESLDFTLGGNNILNTYPTQQDYNSTDNSGYWDSTQMGFGGAYYYARVGFSF